jgi:hypothetical protein
MFVDLAINRCSANSGELTTESCSIRLLIKTVSFIGKLRNAAVNELNSSFTAAHSSAACKAVADPGFQN